MFNKDGRLPPKVARGHLDLLRQERPLPTDLDPQKFVDFPCCLQGDSGCQRFV